MFLADMPLARKVSLKRFLEKRKNRLTAADPYPAAAPAVASESPTKQPPAVKDEGAPWLGVSSALSLS
jgi:jasmonate ZIM domain-containing protein